MIVSDEDIKTAKDLLNTPFSRGYRNGMEDALKSFQALTAQNAALLAAVKEMERMLLPLERLEEGLPQTWEAVNIGTGIATLNGYRDTLEKALEAVKNSNQ